MGHIILMIYIETENKNAAFHFSVEEYFMQCSHIDEPVIMIWQADKCAMIGKNQIAEAEVDIKYAHQNNIQIVRRSSGGGTIFTDLGTLLYTMILPYEIGLYPRQTAQEMLAESVVSALNEMGVPARQEGRNDITVDGKKISGIAQYIKTGRICSHCSLLYDTDLEMLARLLQVDEEKFRSKAIQSVRSRVNNIKSYINIPLDTLEFWKHLKQILLEQQDVVEYKLSETELVEIGKIHDEKYANPSWTFGGSPRFSFRNSRRFAGGKVEVFLDIINGTVELCSIRGDFLGVTPIRELEKLFEQKEFQHGAFDRALTGVELYPYLGDITKEQLLSCVFD